MARRVSMANPEQGNAIIEDRIPRARAIQAAVFLVCFGLIGFEIGLTRLLSVLLSHHYVFVVLSTALLGLGLGGLLARVSRPRLPLVAALLSGSITISVVLVIEVGSDERVHANVLLHAALLLVPFVLGGGLLAEIYRAFPAISPRTYGADLLGGAAGSVGAILLLDSFGGIQIHFAVGALVGLASLILTQGGGAGARRAVMAPLVALLGSCALLAAAMTGLYRPEIPIGTNPAKEIYDALGSFKGRIVETRWSAFGRTDLVSFSEHPDHMDMYLDGTAGSPMYRFTGDLQDLSPALQALKKEFPGYFPFIHLKEGEKDSLLVIGPGGGRDILLALMAGMKRIVAVEVNEELVDLVRRYAAFNGRIYSGLENVQIVVDEGRSFLKRQKENYDMILLSLPVTNTSRSVEGYALTENFLFTTESIIDYLGHLTPEGRLVVVGHNDAEILRLLTLSLSALRRQGIGTTDAMARAYVVGSEDYLVLVVKKSPFGVQEMTEAYASMIRMGYESSSSYFPHLGPTAGLNPTLIALGRGQITPDELIRRVEQRGYDVTPVSDDNPFFYKIDRGTPQAVSFILWTSAALLVIVVGIVLLWDRGRGTAGQRGFPEVRPSKVLLFRFAAAFAMVGIGFMIMEISLIQRLGFFLGRPVLSLALLLCSLLGAAGLGSLWSGRIRPERLDRHVGIAALWVAGGMLGYALLLPGIFSGLLGAGLTIRVCLTVAVLIPLGFLMGIPFPMVIRSLHEKGLAGRIPAMWCINGVASVFGSALTVLVAISLGFTEAMLLSALAYLTVSLLFWRS